MGKTAEKMSDELISIASMVGKNVLMKKHAFTFILKTRIIFYGINSLSEVQSEVQSGRSGKRRRGGQPFSVQLFTAHQ